MYIGCQNTDSSWYDVRAFISSFANSRQSRINQPPVSFYYARQLLWIYRMSEYWYVIIGCQNIDTSLWMSEYSFIKFSSEPYPSAPFFFLGSHEKVHMFNTHGFGHPIRQPPFSPWAHTRKSTCSTRVDSDTLSVSPLLHLRLTREFDMCWTYGFSRLTCVEHVDSDTLSVIGVCVVYVQVGCLNAHISSCHVKHRISDTLTMEVVRVAWMEGF